MAPMAITPHIEDFFGEMGLFDMAEERSAWCRARNACEVAEISYASFNTYTRSHPEIVFTIGQQMAHRLRNTTRKVGDLAFYDVTGRIARTLMACRLRLLGRRLAGW